MKTRNGGGPREGRERSQRQLRVGETLRHALVEVMARDELRDPALAGVSVTVTEIRVSPDLHNATAFVMPLGGEDADAIVAALNHAAPFLRRQLARRVTLRRLPTLGFICDATFDEADRIGGLLHSPRVRRDLEASPDDHPADLPDGEPDGS
jgi:ribosome-binding factor A